MSKFFSAVRVESKVSFNETGLVVLYHGRGCTTAGSLKSVA